MSADTLSRRALGLVAVTTAAAAAVGPAMAQPADIGPLTAGNWFDEIKAQHRAIARLFQAAMSAPDVPGRRREVKRLATLLTGHSIAEEVAVYPGVYIEGDQQGALELYKEQQMAKIMLARIDDALAMNHPDEAMQLLGQLQSAVQAHVHEEEDERFPALMSKADAAMNDKMTRDFRMSFTRYMNG
jgi:hemerythrin superfamily protein